MESLKLLHITCAVTTGIFFFVRGLWMIGHSPLLDHRLTKILPHCVDTLLLLSALALLAGGYGNPLNHFWLAGKIFALVIYIGLGMMAFRLAQSRRAKIVYWLLALLALATIYSLALLKPLSF